MRVFAIVNQKGGVGKTTTAINLATALAACDKKTLIIDMDPQGNASTGLGISNANCEVTIYDLLLGDENIDKAIIQTFVPNLSLLPSSIDLSGAELELIDMEQRQYRLLKIIEKIDAIRFDYVLIDCPPSFGLMTLNALCAANATLIPLQCEFFALEGLSQILKRIKDVKNRFNNNLTLQGVVLTMYDKRNKLSAEVEQNVRKHLGDLVYESVIPRNVRLSEAPSHGKPALIYDIKCQGSKAYLNLASELINRENILQAS